MIVDERGEFGFDSVLHGVVSGIVEGAIRMHEKAYLSEATVFLTPSGRIEIVMNGERVAVEVTLLERAPTPQEEFARYLEPASHAETESHGRQP